MLNASVIFRITARVDAVVVGKTLLRVVEVASLAEAAETADVVLESVVEETADATIVSSSSKRGKNWSESQLQCNK